jgi:hypothetical protein
LPTCIHYDYWKQAKRTAWRQLDVDVKPQAADGIKFLCPKCFVTNSGPVGTHAIICWRPHVPAEIVPGPGRWEFEGDSIHELTLVASSSSISLPGPGGCLAHFFVRKGSIVDA